MSSHSFEPCIAKVAAIEPLSASVRVFTFEVDRLFFVAPGRFAEVILPGVGSFPVSACGYVATGMFQACIRQVGRVTGALFRCGVGDAIGLRGPFGQGFPLQAFNGQDLTLIAGGLGIAPVRALLQRLLSSPLRSIRLLYGARRAADLLFLPELQALAAEERIELRLAVDEPLSPICASPLWRRGPVTDLLAPIGVNQSQAAVVACGPPAMYAALRRQLAVSELAADRVYLTLERRMRCGIGECGHCVAGGRHVCTEGPVFTLAELQQMPGALQ